MEKKILHIFFASLAQIPKDDFVYVCSSCKKEYPIDSKRYLCDDCSKKNKKGLPLEGTLLVKLPEKFIKTCKNFILNNLDDFENFFLENEFINDDLTIDKSKDDKLINDKPINDKYFNDSKKVNSKPISIPVLPFFPVESKFFPSLPIGKTPAIFSKRLCQHLGVKDLLLKWEGTNISGSYKDRASILVSSLAKKFNEDTLSVASTGNAASSISAVCANMEQNLFVFAPAKAPIAKLVQILQYGANLFLIDGSYDEAFDLSMQFSQQLGFISRNTGYNPLTIEGKKSAAFELLFPRAIRKGLENDLSKNGYTPFVPPDYIFVPVGDGVILSGLIKGFNDLKDCGFIDRFPKIIGVQSSNSNYIESAFRTGIFKENYQATTLADSISVNSPRCGYLAIDFLKKCGGDMISVSDDEILDAQILLSSLTGIFAEPSSAATIAGIIRYKKEAINGLDPFKKIVALLTATGLKDIESAKKKINLPESLPPDFNRVMNYYEKLKK